MNSNLTPARPRQPPPRRLALVITELEVGGAEKNLVHLAVGIDRGRFEPVVYSLGPRPPAGRDALVEKLAQAQIPTHFLDLRSAWQLISGAARLARLLQDQQPDIVQTFLFHANVIGAWAAGRCPGAKCVAGIRVADPTRWRIFVERWAVGRASRIACVSEAVARFCREHCRFPADKLVAIANGVELSRFYQVASAELSSLGLAAGRRVILFVGRLDPQKGLDELLQNILPDVLPALPQHDLVLVGDGPSRESLQALARSLGVAERVHFAGWRADVPALLAAADLLVLPSRYEGMPNVVLEAMASGLPVIATRVEGVEELLGPLSEPQTAPRGDFPGFARRMIDLARDRDQSARMGRQNRQRATDHFSLPAMILAYEQLYDSLF